jgi:hypothetical protein
VIGTLNPSAGDVSLFLPVEQAPLADTVAAGDLTAIFSRYNVAGALTGAIGALASALPAIIAARVHSNPVAAERWGFIAYAILAVIAATIYWSLTPPSKPNRWCRRAATRAIARHRNPSGGALQPRFIRRRTHDPVAARPVVVSPLPAFDSGRGLVLLRHRIARRVLATRLVMVVTRMGRIRTMAYTHIPANLCLMIAGMMPNVALALTFLLLRASMSSMDVPARQCYVMAVVPPEERAAAERHQRTAQSGGRNGTHTRWGPAGLLTFRMAA